jgi:hypothetical protein
MNLYYILIAILVLVIGESLLLASNRSEEDGWAQFKEAHQCKPVGSTDGSNRAGYLCDDGEVHYRWRQMR